MAEKKSLGYRSIALQALDKAVSSASNRHDANLLRAKRAAILAHSSELEEAKAEIGSLREANKAVDPRLSAWLIYCDGHIYYSEGQEQRSALGRFRMANIFAIGLKDAELAGLTSAWIAHCHFLNGEIEQVPEYLSQAFKWSSPNHWSPLARASLVLADTLAWAGNEDRARPWYHKARSYSASAGEISMQNSVIYNSAAFRVSNLSLAQIQGLSTKKQAMLAETEVTSASTLNALTENRNSPQLIALLRAELFTILGDWEKALIEFDIYFSNDVLEERYVPKLVAERALCLARLGMIERAVADFESALLGLKNCCDLDDLAVLHFRVYEVAEILKLTDLSAQHLAVARFALAQFQATQKKILSLMEPLAEEVQIRS